jgi:hypothetical protein
LSEDKNHFSLKIDTPLVKINLNGSSEFIEKMFNIIIEDFLVQQNLLGIIEEEEEEEELDEEEIKEIEKIEKDVSGVSLDEFKRSYKFNKPQEKLIITALWLTKTKKKKELNNAYINKVLDDSGFRKIDHINDKLEALRNKEMITIISAPPGKRKIYKLTKEDITKIEEIYKLDKSE